MGSSMGSLRKLRSHTRQSMTQFEFVPSCERDLPGPAIMTVGGPEFLENGLGSNRGSYAASGFDANDPPNSRFGGNKRTTDSHLSEFLDRRPEGRTP